MKYLGEPWRDEMQSTSRPRASASENPISLYSLGPVPSSASASTSTSERLVCSPLAKEPKTATFRKCGYRFDTSLMTLATCGRLSTRFPESPEIAVSYLTTLSSHKEIKTSVAVSTIPGRTSTNREPLGSAVSLTPFSDDSNVVDARLSLTRKCSRSLGRLAFAAHPVPIFHR